MALEARWGGVEFMSNATRDPSAVKTRTIQPVEDQTQQLPVVTAENSLTGAAPAKQ